MPGDFWAVAGWVLGLYGATLSTWTAIERRLEAAPVFALSKDDTEGTMASGNWLQISIYNPGKHAILVLDLTSNNDAQGAIRSLGTGASEIKDIVRIAATRRLNMVVQPGQSGTIRFLLDDDAKAMDLLLRWRRETPALRRVRTVRFRRTRDQLQEIQKSML
ncbi:hypothetical protein [Inquilinus sp.]|uniref:hypothetical protein n=1 Tax=Inquilinus sp. TaxID=1932117 RepID=UPI0031D3CAB7